MSKYKKRTYTRPLHPCPECGGTHYYILHDGCVKCINKARATKQIASLKETLAQKPKRVIKMNPNPACPTRSDTRKLKNWPPGMVFEDITTV